MIVMILWYIMLAFLLIRVAIALYNFYSQPYLPANKPKEQPLVSLLIPARNEAHNLPQLLTMLQDQAYEHLEIIVLDDHSSDGTGEVAQAFASRDPRITIIQGMDLPEGWLGKNFACHQLAEAAKGEFFLFLDADTLPGPDFLCAMIAEVEEKQLSLLSVFPRQIMVTYGERKVVPLMHYLLLSMLPLKWVYNKGNPAFAAANGQAMCFNAADYHKHHWHQRVKSAVTEDIQVMKAVKRERLRGEVLLTEDLIKCRMYRSRKEGMEGFSKNLLAGFGNSGPGLLIFLFLTIWGYVLAIFFVPLELLLFSFALIVLLRIVVSLTARQQLHHNLVLHPVQMLLLTAIALRSIYKGNRGTNYWKGRKI